MSNSHTTGEEPRLHRRIRFLVGVASLVVIVGAIHFAQAIVVPFLLSLFISIISLPPLAWMQRKRIPGPVAMSILFVAHAATLGGIVLLLGQTLSDFSNDLPAYKAQLETQLDWVKSSLADLGVDLDLGSAEEPMDPGFVVDLVGTILEGLANAFGNAFLIVLTVMFIMLEAPLLKRKLESLSGYAQHAPRTNRIINDIRRYMTIKTLTSLLTGIVITIVLALIGVSYPVLWGLLAFLCNYVPNIGSAISAFPPSVLALVEFGLLPALGVGFLFIAVTSIVGNIIEPKAMGRGLNLSTLVVFLSLVFWGWVLGPVGMLLSVPLTMTAIIALETDEDARWLAVLMSAQVPDDGDQVRQT